MSKHTPGPWRTIESANTTMRTVIGPDFPGQGYIADVNLCRTNNAQDVDGEANARLIAAAPELLAALKAVLQHEGERVCSGIGTEHPSEALENALHAATAAINKAEGREG